MAIFRIGGALCALTLILSLPAYAGAGRGHKGGKGGGYHDHHHHHDRHHRHYPRRSFSPIEVAPQNITINSASFSGDGCDGAMPMITPDKQDLVLFYPSFFVAHTGSTPGKKIESDTSNCKARIRMEVPAGYQFAIVSGTGTGQAILDADASGEFSVKYGFDIKEKQSRSSKLKIPGPYANNYEHSFEMPLKAVSWSSCTGYQRDLVIDTAISVRTKGNASGVMTVDSSDYELNHEYGLVWRECQDRTRAVIAVCRAQYTQDGDFFEVQGHAKARTEDEAIARAQDRALDRCEDASNGGTCTLPVDPCQIQAI